jgi:hypothetical protein
MSVAQLSTILSSSMLSFSSQRICFMKFSKNACSLEVTGRRLFAGAIVRHMNTIFLFARAAQRKFSLALAEQRRTALAVELIRQRLQRRVDRRVVALVSHEVPREVLQHHCATAAEKAEKIARQILPE